MIVYLNLQSGNFLQKLNVKQVPRLDEVIIIKNTMYRVVNVVYNFDINRTDIVINNISSEKGSK